MLLQHHNKYNNSQRKTSMSIKSYMRIHKGEKENGEGGIRTLGLSVQSRFKI